MNGMMQHFGDKHHHGAFVNIRMNGMKSRSDFISLKFSKVPLFYERLRFREWLRVGNKRFFF
jgi:hypothetical protein